MSVITRWHGSHAFRGQLPTPFVQFNQQITTARRRRTVPPERDPAVLQRVLSALERL